MNLKPNPTPFNLYGDRAVDVRIKDYLSRQELYKDKDVVITGMKTGLVALDQTTMGLQESDLWIVQGRTGVGKTWLLCHFANVMRGAGHRVLFVNREMEPVHVMGRVDALAARFSYQRWRKGKLTTEELGRYLQMGKVIKEAQARGKFKGRIDIVPPTDNFKPSTLAWLVGKYKPDVVIVDYLNRMESDKDDFDNLRAMRNIADALKDLAYKGHVPVIAAAQTNRASLQKGGSGIPGTEHIFGGDIIGWNSDLVLSLFQTASMVIKSEMGLVMVKYRHGEELAMLLEWNLEEGKVSVKKAVPRARAAELMRKGGSSEDEDELPE